MNDAVKYFQKNGLQRSKELVEMGFGFCSLEDGLSFHTEQLKQLVKSHELVASWGGLADAKKELQRQSILRWINPETERLRVAIADVESCTEAGKRLEVK
ncbi:hypothetical protein KMZ14_06220 [Acinetobacter schindleri]|uniref:hypothetical protein n=1 Tax=Acinetobacter schindleri TaxID=108981 RepID=UPI00235ED6CF|nr:hypothetical protein [Acinetobacter schindleri]WDE17129.1 hypothetical protein KMZ14_06220 [Acinetobacter schindleri]